MLLQDFAKVVNGLRPLQNVLHAAFVRLWYLCRTCCVWLRSARLFLFNTCFLEVCLGKERDENSALMLSCLVDSGTIAES